jgi:hypothetical protein
MSDNDYAPGPIPCRGAFTGEFGLGPELSLEEAPYVIERDRINEARREGFNRKLLPMALDRASGERTAGGYYLLDTEAQARAMYDWYRDPVEGFVLDGIPILRRAYFIDPAAHWWRVLGAHDFQSIETCQKVVRFERWRDVDPGAEAAVAREWPALRDEAAARGLSAVWLLWNAAQPESLGLVSVADGSAGRDQAEPDFAALERLAGMESVGRRFEGSGLAARSFDRTSWIFSIWFPYRDWRSSRRTLWPNAPPFPGL